MACFCKLMVLNKGRVSPIIAGLLVCLYRGK
nr:MAG TPA: hypothetical protein [Caudoviricetes sp.]